MRGAGPPALRLPARCALHFLPASVLRALSICSLCQLACSLDRFLVLGRGGKDKEKKQRKEKRRASLSTERWSERALSGAEH